MKDNMLYLSAGREQDTLKISLYSRGDVICPYESLLVPMQNTETLCRELTAMLNRLLREGKGGERDLQELRLLGRNLCRELLPRSMRQQLMESETGYLMLHLDFSLLSIPWELLCPDEDFLCHRFSMGRRVNMPGKNGSISERSLTRPLRMWIIANPKGNLPAADAEGESLFEETEGMNRERAVIEPVLDSDISPQDLKNSIKNYDLLHFAGHVRYDPEYPEKSGWELSGGHFTLADIEELRSGMAMPAFVFSNACHSARMEAADSFSASGTLAEAFLRAGVRHYLGTCREIPDTSGKTFALRFYRHLLAGKSVGQAVKDSRRELSRETPHISWTAYILYGNPQTRYFARESVHERERGYAQPIRGQEVPLQDRKTGQWQHRVSGIFLLLLIPILLSVFIIMGKADRDETREIRQLMERADRIQQRTERLIKELAELLPDLPEAEKTEKEIPALAMIFDSHAAAGPKEKMILFAIQSELMESQTAFRLLERESFDKVLEEIIRRRRLRPEEKHSPLKLILPQVLVILEMNNADPAPLLLMRVTDARSGVLIANLFEKAETDRSIMSQKEKLAASLLRTLKTIY